MKRDTILRATERNIWILWLQGFDTAPDIVKVCSASWVARNPGWRVHFLTWETVRDHLGEEFLREISALQLPPQKMSNLIRLHLISRYGGVWADADCLCVQPLDDWLPHLMQGGFFAFRFGADRWLERNRSRLFSRFVGRSSDRILANWFLAGRAGNAVSSEFLRRHLSLLASASLGERPLNRPLLRLALLFLRRNAYLASWLADLRLLQATAMLPYFIFHYHFARTVIEDQPFRQAWRAVSQAEVGNALTYSKTMHMPADELFRRDILGHGSSPVYKFHWKLQEGTMISGSRYLALLELYQPEERHEVIVDTSRGSAD